MAFQAHSGYATLDVAVAFSHGTFLASFTVSPNAYDV